MNLQDNRNISVLIIPKVTCLIKIDRKENMFVDYHGFGNWKRSFSIKLLRLSNQDLQAMIRS